jgi:hypothetical protein
MTCIRCPNARWNWVWYIMAAYLPLTLFYFVILLFKVNITSSHLFAAVYYCQTMSMPLLMRIIFSIVGQQVSSSFLTAAKVCFSLYGIWNLDFFRLFYSEMCLGTGVLPTLALDYIIAFYPLLLMVISYLLIALYDKNYRIVNILWRPFRELLSVLWRKWDVKTSMIDVFATFFFLSYVRLLSVSFDLLIPTRVYNFYPDHYNYTLGLLYAGHIEYFGKEHLPYALLALGVLSIFVILPLVVLALYPFSFFQAILNLFPFRWYILHTFVDSFYGCYKDGTQPGSHDYRWFVSFFFGIRAVQFLLYSIPDATVSLALYVNTVFLHTALVAIFQPFKSFDVNYNVAHILFLQFTALLASTVIMINLCTYLAPQYMELFYIIAIIFIFIPLFYFFFVTLYWFYRRKKFNVNIVQRLKAWRKGYDLVPEGSGGPLPDRLENSGDYSRNNLTNFVSVRKVCPP